MARVARRLSDTGIYHVMLRGNERKEIFKGIDEKQQFLASVAGKQAEEGFPVYAYCLMDNHVHLLFQVNEDRLAPVMKGIEVRYASFYNRKYDRVGHVFQDRFRSEPVDNDRRLLAVVRYIHNNPVKAGLVREPGEYQWSSYRDYLHPATPWLDTGFVMGLLGRDKNEAIQEFERLSALEEDGAFIDIDEGRIKTSAQGRHFIQEYLHKKYPDITMDEIRSNPQVCQEVIQQLRAHTDLSMRAIADLLGVNRGTVFRNR